MFNSLLKEIKYYIVGKRLSEQKLYGNSKETGHLHHLLPGYSIQEKPGVNFQ